MHYNTCSIVDFRTFLANSILHADSPATARLLLWEYLKESISQRIEHPDQALVKHKD